MLMNTSARSTARVGHRTRRKAKSTGFMLVEALFGILLFSVGIIALIGLQATSIKQSVAGKYRSDASLLAGELIGQMWTSDRTLATLQANFNSDHASGGNCASSCGVNFNAWYTEVQAALPGADSTPPTIVFESIPGSSAGLTSTKATLTIYWRAPNEDSSVAAHNYTVITQIK
jgi:type IV pilus assembly protein PilV